MTTLGFMHPSDGGDAGDGGESDGGDGDGGGEEGDPPLKGIVTTTNRHWITTYGQTLGHEHVKTAGGGKSTVDTLEQGDITRVIKNGDALKHTKIASNKTTVIGESNFTVDTTKNHDITLALVTGTNEDGSTGFSLEVQETFSGGGETTKTSESTKVVTQEKINERREEVDGSVSDWIGEGTYEGVEIDNSTVSYVETTTNDSDVAHEIVVLENGQENENKTREIIGENTDRSRETSHTIDNSRTNTYDDGDTLVTKHFVETTSSTISGDGFSLNAGQRTRTLHRTETSRETKRDESTLNRTELHIENDDDETLSVDTTEYAHTFREEITDRSDKRSQTKVYENAVFSDPANWYIPDAGITSSHRDSEVKRTTTIKDTNDGYLDVAREETLTGEEYFGENRTTFHHDWNNTNEDSRDTFLRTESKQDGSDRTTVRVKTTYKNDRNIHFQKNGDADFDSVVSGETIDFNSDHSDTYDEVVSQDRLTDVTAHIDANLSLMDASLITAVVVGDTLVNIAMPGIDFGLDHILLTDTTVESYEGHVNDSTTIDHTRIVNESGTIYDFSSHRTDIWHSVTSENTNTELSGGHQATTTGTTNDFSTHTWNTHGHLEYLPEPNWNDSGQETAGEGLVDINETFDIDLLELRPSGRLTTEGVVVAKIFDAMQDTFTFAFDYATEEVTEFLIAASNPGVTVIHVYPPISKAGEYAIDAAAGLVDGFLDTINPIDPWYSIPDIGPVFGNKAAYNTGYVGGAVAGIGVQFAAGFVSGGATWSSAVAGSVKLGVYAAKAYTAIDTVAGVVNGGAALYDVYQNGDKMSGLEMGAKLAGAGLNLSSGIGAAAGKMFKRATPGGLYLGGCFVAGTKVHVDALPAGHAVAWTREEVACLPSGEPVPSRESVKDPCPSPTATIQRPLTSAYQVAIEDVPLGSRIGATNPDGSGFDVHSTDASQQVCISMSIRKDDGATIHARFLRHHTWAEGLVVGGRMYLEVEELGVAGLARVNAIEPAPQFADGPGNVVTGRFVTQENHQLVRLRIAGGESFEGTPIHPVWIINRQEFVPLSEVEPNDLVDTLAGPASVHAVEPFYRTSPVYNLEVEGQHVYRIGTVGMLVHNTYAGASKRILNSSGQPIPFGFSSADEFSQFGARLNAGLPGGAQTVFQGSSVTGKSFRTGARFDVGRVSDFDIGISSQSLFNRASQLDPKFGLRVKTAPNRIGPLGDDALEELGLKSLRDSLSSAAGGRHVEFLLFDNLNSAFRRPSIFVP